MNRIIRRPSPLNLGTLIDAPFRRCGRDSVALIGGSQLDAFSDPPPFHDPLWEIWGCNAMWKLHKDNDGRFRADRWFELHPMSVQTADELRCIQECPVPIYLLWDQNEQLDDVQLADVPMRVRYPLEAMRSRFGDRDYFTCTMAYQVALALVEGFRTIALYGFELWQGSGRERVVELPCLEYWLGVAKGMGVQLVLPSYSRLIWSKHLYGYDYDKEFEDVKDRTINTGYRIMVERWYEHRKDRRPKRKKANA